MPWVNVPQRTAGGPRRAGRYRRGVSQPRRVYFDAASAAPLHPAARAAWQAALDEGWADPGRLYAESRRARLLLDSARATVAEALGAQPDEVSFTSSGSTALHLGILGALAARRRTGTRLVTSAVEHSAALHSADQHVAAGGEHSVVPVDRFGQATADGYAGTLDAGPPAGLAVLQSANHEVGTRQPVPEVAAACAARGVPLLVDAAQTLGREPVPDGWQLLAASARKWGGPPGVGVLVVRRGVRWRSPLPAGEQEGGRVPGAVNLPGALAAAAALAGRLADTGAPAEQDRLRGLVDRLRAELPLRIPDIEVVGHPTDRLAHLVTFSCLYVDGEALVTALDEAGFAVSSGSSCTSSTLEPSHVLVAMGVLTHGNVRVSLPDGAPAEDVERFLEVAPEVVARIRRTAGVSP